MLGPFGQWTFLVLAPVSASCLRAFPAPQVYKAVRQDLEEGGRVFVVCPLVEASKNEATADLMVQPLLPLLFG